MYQFLSNQLVQKAPGTPGNVTHHTYDLAGRQISVTRGYGTSNASTTTYTYYDDGRKQSETDALGHVTTYAYDAAGRLTSVSGVQGNMQYGYDDAGNQISRTDGNGNTTGETRVAQERDRHLRLVVRPATSNSESSTRLKSVTHTHSNAQRPRGY